jgi:hypothetical protein
MVASTDGVRLSCTNRSSVHVNQHSSFHPALIHTAADCSRSQLIVYVCGCRCKVSKSLDTEVLHHGSSLKWCFVVLRGASVRVASMCMHRAEHVTHVFIKLPASWAHIDASRLITLLQCCNSVYCRALIVLAQ